MAQPDARGALQSGSIMNQLTYKNLVGPKIRSLRLQFSWTQEALAMHLRQMGWPITRSTLAKVEARLVHVSDSDLLYFVRLFEVEPDYLFPELDRDEQVGTAVRRLLSREHVGAAKRPQIQLSVSREVRPSSM